MFTVSTLLWIETIIYNPFPIPQEEEIIKGIYKEDNKKSTQGREYTVYIFSNQKPDISFGRNRRYNVICN